MKKSLATAATRQTRTHQVSDSTPPAADAYTVEFVRWKNPAFVVLSLFIFIYYFWTVQPGVTSGIDENSYYNYLTDAFLEGQTSLLILPRPELLRLTDPYDPKLNEPYRLHDVSLYKGRYYLYFGATPVVTLFLPFRLITGTHLPERIGCMYFAFAAFIVSCMLLELLLTIFLPATPTWLFYVSCLTLGFINAFPHLLRRPSIYETAIVSGQFFLACAVYVIAAASLRTAWATPWRLVAGGVALGLAFGARPPLLLAFPLATLLLFFPRSESKFTRRGTFVMFAAGFVLIASCVAIYNYVRFDSFFSFGNRYQLAGVDTTKIQYFSPARVPGNLWFYTICPPSFQATFPFVLLSPKAPPFTLPNNFMWPEEVEGIFWASPLVVMLPFAWWLYRGRQRIEFSAWVYGLALVAAVLMCFDAMLSATMRYLADFSAALGVAAILSWHALANFNRRRSLALAAFLSLSGLGIANQGFIAFTGYNDKFRTLYPEQYQALVSLFSPLSEILQWFLQLW